MGGLLFHLLHQPWALNDVGKTRIIFHVGGDGELAAGLDALNQHGFKHRPRRVDRSGVTCGTGTDDDDLGMDGGRHRGRSLSLREFGQRLGGMRSERHRGGAESANPSLGYLASYARIAIHTGEFSPPTGKLTHRTRNKVALVPAAALRLFPEIIFQALSPQDPDPACRRILTRSTSKSSAKSRPTAESPTLNWPNASAFRPRPACAGCERWRRPAISRAIADCWTRAGSASTSRGSPRCICRARPTPTCGHCRSSCAPSRWCGNAGCCRARSTSS